MHPSDWTAKAAFMREVGATDGAWEMVYDGTKAYERLVSLKLAAQAPRPAQPTAAAAPQGPAAKTAAAFAERLKREHETRFAASHFKPRLDVPTVTDNVPRAVRDREAVSGNRPPNKPKRR
jgi:hypothetical protein